MPLLLDIILTLSLSYLSRYNIIGTFDLSWQILHKVEFSMGKKQ